jgi:phosphoribosylpyrophosphate synthetase
LCFGTGLAIYKSITTRGVKEMKAILNFFGFAKQEVKKAHSYRKAITAHGVYAKREDGLEYFIASDLLN